jgi:Zn-dependent peptidase ImmA (M78 family)/DNA-binding XRE family transcriptional regulator
MFNGNELRLARQYHGFSLNELAESIGTSRQYVHQLETGRTQPTIQTIELLADNLKVLPEFFDIAKLNTGYLVEEQFHFRKNITTKLTCKQTVKARGIIFERVVNYLDEQLNLPYVNFPNHEVEINEDIEKLAEKMRHHWDLGMGPISNMVRVVENAGAVVTYFDGVSTSVDALSITAKRPVIVRNDSKQSPFRLRFDLAHEAGHLIMHEGQVTGDRLTESQANRFASAFLMPRTTFVKDFLIAGLRGSQFNWQGLSDIKMKWKVNKAAILYRAKDLNLIDSTQYTKGVIHLKNSAQGIKEIEDDNIEKENYELLNNAIICLNDYCKINTNEFVNNFAVTPEFLKIIMKLPKSPPQLKLIK